MDNYPLQITDYIKVYENIIPEKLNEKLIKFAKRKDVWQKHLFVDYAGSVTQAEEDCDVSYIYGFDPVLEQETCQIVAKGIENYYSYFDNFIQGVKYKFNGFTPLRLNRYDKNHLMKRHVDHISSMFDGTRRGIPTLSVVGVLNDNYKGGEFLFFNGYEVKIPAASILIFPSVFIYQHMVNYVTKGTRYSFVSWVW